MLFHRVAMLDSGHVQRRLYSPTRSNARWTDSLRCRRHFPMCNLGDARDEPPGLPHGGDLSRDRGRDGPRSRHGKSARFLACRGEQAGGGLLCTWQCFFLLVYRGCVRTRRSHSTCGIGFAVSYCSFRSCTTPRCPCFSTTVEFSSILGQHCVVRTPQCGSVPSYAYV